jgi:hypothetical protein
MTSPTESSSSTRRQAARYRAWDKDLEHAMRSVHCEGRGVDFTTFRQSWDVSKVHCEHQSHVMFDFEVMEQ